MLHAELARTNPNGLALDDGVRRRTWSELADRTTRLANWIEALGARPGDHVAVWMGNRAECVELMIAGIQAGVWLTPINWHLTRDEIAYVIGDSGARVLFTDEAYAALARELFAGPVVVAGEELEAGLRAASDAPKRPDAPAGGPMIYTSGTTGRPKGVKRHRAATLAAARDGQIAYARAIGVDAPGSAPDHGPVLPRRAAHVRGLRADRRRADPRDAALGGARPRSRCSASARSARPISCRRCSRACCACPTRSARRSPRRRCAPCCTAPRRSRARPSSA